MYKEQGLFDDLTSRPIGPQDWQHRAGVWTLSLAAPTSSSRLEVSFEGVPEGGTAYSVHLDGEELDCWVIDRPGTYRTEVRAHRGPHDFELRRLGGGGGATPGAARWLVSEEETR